MAEVIPFPSLVVSPPDDDDIDLLTAVDVAIRDLREIADRWDQTARAQADECRLMLERAYAAALFCQG
jgi:hypothetical protein